MSTFLDDNMGTFNASQSFTSADPWQQLEDPSIPHVKMSAPEMYGSVDTLLLKPGIYGPDMRGSYPRDITGHYLELGYNHHSD
jgi:hypothetical protein